MVSMLAVCAAGCSSAVPVSSATPPPSQQASSAPPPSVDDCTLLNLSPPAKYVCGDGKVYTSDQLRELREGTTPAGTATK